MKKVALAKRAPWSYTIKNPIDCPSLLQAVLSEIISQAFGRARQQPRTELSGHDQGLSLP